MTTLRGRRTALHLAASEGNIHIVQALLDQGANAFSYDRWGHSPVTDAKSEGHSKIEALLESVMDRSNTQDNGNDAVRSNELRLWLIAAGIKENEGLSGVIEKLNTEGVRDRDLLALAWTKLEPKLKIGPATRIGMALAEMNRAM